MFAEITYTSSVGLFWHKDLSVCHSVCLSLDPSVSLSAILFVCLPVNLSLLPPINHSPGGSSTCCISTILCTARVMYVCVSVCGCLSLSTSPLLLPPTNHSPGGSSSCCIYTSCERTCLSVCLSVSQSFHHSSYLSTTPAPGGSSPCCISTILCTAGRNVCVCLSVCVRLPVS